jgi:hypothetical protein
MIFIFIAVSINVASQNLRLAKQDLMMSAEEQEQFTKFLLEQVRVIYMYMQSDMIYNYRFCHYFIKIIINTIIATSKRSFFNYGKMIASLSLYFQNFFYEHFMTFVKLDR